MSFKTPEEAKTKTCIFRWVIKMLKPGQLDGEYKLTNCIGSECAQYALGRHRCGLV